MDSIPADYYRRFLLMLNARVTDVNVAQLTTIINTNPDAINVRGFAADAALIIKQLRRAMADAHPDRGGTVEQFIQARRRCQTHLAPRNGGPGR